MPKNDDMGNLG